MRTRWSRMSGEGNDNGKSERIEYGWNDKTKRIKEAKKRERKGKNTNTKRSAMKAKEKKRRQAGNIKVSNSSGDESDHRRIQMEKTLGMDWR